MKYCNECGAELNDDVKFCINCGAKCEGEVEATEPTVAVDKAEPQPVKRKSDFMSFFDKAFWVVFVLSGMLGYLALSLARLYMSVSNAFAILLGVVAIVSSAVFLASAIIRLVASVGENAEARKANALKRSLCLVVSAVVFGYVLMGSIAIFIIVA